MLEDNKDDKKEEEFEVVEEGAEVKTGVAEDDVAPLEDEQDESEEDQSLASAGQVKSREDGKETNADRKKRRRKVLKEKLDQKDAVIRGLQQQVRQQNERITAQERRATGHEKVMIDKALSDARDNLVASKNAYAHSLTTGEPGMVAEAMDLHYAAKRKVEELENIQQQVARAPQQTAIQPADTNVVKNTNTWMNRNRWFTPGGTDRDSRLATVIDNEVAEDGFDPRTSEYWRELDRRLLDVLPHRVRTGRREEIDDDEDGQEMQTQSQQVRQRVTPRQVVSTSGESGGGRRRITLSKERIQAIKDAGYWENQVERNKMVKSYLEFDRNQLRGESR